METLRPNVSLHRRSGGQSLWVCGLAATALALVISCISPPLYQSSARFEILKDSADAGLQLLRSPETLALAGIHPARVTFQAVPESTQIEVTVMDEDPQRAANLANSLAGAYQQARANVAAVGRPELLSSLETVMGEASAAFETVKQESEAVAQSLERARSHYGEDPDAPWRRQAELEAAIAEGARLQAQLDELRKSPFPEFLHVANRHKLINSDRMTWVAEYLGMMTTLQALTQAGLPDSHSDIFRAKKRIADLRLQMDKDAVDLTSSMALQIHALNQRVISLNSQKEADRAVLVKASAAAKVAAENHRAAQIRLRDARIEVEAVRATEAAQPEYIAVSRSAKPLRRPAQPGFWIPLLLSPGIGVGIGFLLRRFRVPRTGPARTATA